MGGDSYTKKCAKAYNYSDPLFPTEVLNLNALCVFRCTSDDWLSYPNYQVAIPLYCRGVTSRNQAILAMPPSMYEQEKPVGCKLINSRVSVPLQLEDSQFWSPMEGLVLTWSEPSCRICENQGKLCGFKSDTGSDIACSNPPPSKGMLFNIFSLLSCIWFDRYDKDNNFEILVRV